MKNHAKNHMQIKTLKGSSANAMLGDGWKTVEKMPHIIIGMQFYCLMMTNVVIFYCSKMKEQKTHTFCWEKED